jgi:hypothetical protein
MGFVTLVKLDAALVAFAVTTGTLSAAVADRLRDGGEGMEDDAASGAVGEGTDAEVEAAAVTELDATAASRIYSTMRHHRDAP